MGLIRNISIALLLITTWTNLHAQVFPVQVTTQLVAPYSLYLSDYVAPGTERLVMTAFLNDISRPELNVRLRLRIVGQNITIESRPDYMPAPLALHGGIPLRLTSADLAGYFETQHLNFQGITRREYEQRGKLPEGVYQFCFEVLEYNRGVKISNTGCATAWMILNDPPLINIPQQNEKIKPLSPQNVILQWTPRHTGSPNSAFTTEYEVKMVEVWPATRNSNDAILTSPPIFETTTRSSTVIYGPAETPLEPGRRYAFRVQAKSIVGVDELDLFKNNGYSEVFSFVYGDACIAPANVEIESVGSNRFKAKWTSQFNHTSFKIRYRQAGSQVWYTNQTSINEAEIYSLKPNTTYEYEVSGTCGFFEGAYTSITSVKTTEAPLLNYSCGLPLETFPLDPSQLTGSLKVGDVINAGDFDVQLTKVSGGNGLFSGEGVISMSYLRNAKVKAEFSDITVNKDLRMVKGYMNITGAGVEIVPAGVMNFMDQLDEALDVADSALSLAEEIIPDEIPNPATFVADTLVTIKGEILAVVKNPVSGNVVVTTTTGQTQELAPGTSYAVTDSKGNGYLVDSNGNVGKTTAELATKTAKREYNLIVAFNEAAQAKYGFDKKPTETQYNNLSGYEQLEGGYRVAWKAVASNTVDPVTAKLEKNDVDKSEIRFQQNGIDISTAPFTSDNTTIVSVRGNIAGEVEDLTAIITPADTSKKEQVLGKLKVITYDGINNNLVIVPVNNVKYPSTDVNLTQLKTQLNKIYAQAAVSWNVSLANKIDVTLPETFDDGASGLLTNYTGDMKSVINAYKSNFTPNTYYLFLVEKPASGKTLGFMPRSKQAGFIFVDMHGGDENLLIKTMAHELGHGAFTLKHTFSDDVPLQKESTDNLMDYNNGVASRLYKHQWDRIHNPTTVLGLFEEDEEGQNQITDIDACHLKANDLVSDLQAAKKGGKSIFNIEIEKYLYKCASSLSMDDLKYIVTGDFDENSIPGSFDVVTAKFLFQTTIIENPFAIPKSIAINGREVKLRVTQIINGNIDLNTLKVNKKVGQEHVTYYVTINSYDDRNEIGLQLELFDLEHLIILLNYFGLDGKAYREKFANELVTILKEKTDCDNLDVILENLPVDIVKTKLTYTDKLNYLKILSGCSVDEFGTNEERAVLNLLQGIENSKELIEALRGDLISRLDHRMDGDNHYLFAIEISKHVIKANPPSQQDQINASIVKSVLNSNGSGFSYNLTFPFRNRFLQKDERYSVFFAQNQLTVQIKNDWWFDENSITLPDKLDPFDYVALSIDQSVAKELGIPQEINLIPAIYFRAVSLKQNFSDVKKALRAGFDGALFLYGGFATTSARTFVGKAFFYADLILPTVDIAVQLSDLSADPNFKDFSEVYDAIYTCYAVISVIRLTSPAFQEKAENFVAFWKKNRDKSNLTTTQKNQIDDSVSKLEREIETQKRLFSLVDVATNEITKSRIPSQFMDGLKSLGKSEDEIVEYFTKYHNDNGGLFFNQVEELPVQFPGITRTEAYTLWGYTTDNFYLQLNDWLRKKINSSQTEKLENILESALSKLPKYSDGVAYRAIGFKSTEMDKLAEFLTNHKKGNIVKYDEFISCGSSKEAAFYDKASKNVRIVIEDLSPAADISAFADGVKFRGYPTKELLLEPGRSFEVLDYFEKDGIHFIKLKQF